MMHAPLASRRQKQVFKGVRVRTALFLTMTTTASDNRPCQLGRASLLSTYERTMDSIVCIPPCCALFVMCNQHFLVKILKARITVRKENDIMPNVSCFMTYRDISLTTGGGDRHVRGDHQISPPFYSEDHQIPGVKNRSITKLRRFQIGGITNFHADSIGEITNYHG